MQTVNVQIIREPVFRVTVMGGGGSGAPGSGTVTSVGLALPVSLFSVSGSPVTSAGTLTGTLATQTANTVWAGPTTGAAAAPTFRALVAGDIPTIAQSQVTSLTTDLANKQPLDSDLTAIAGLTATNDDFIQRKAGAWANRTIAQVKTDLGLTGTNSGDQTITLTGDVTGSGTGSFAATIAASAVTFAKIQNITTARLLGRSTAGSGVVEEISIGSGLTLSAGVLSATGGGGSGTVTSVGLSLPAIFSVSGSPVTTSGTLTGTLATQTANTVWAGPTTGVAAAPTFRALVAGDIPTIAQSQVTSLTTDLANKQPLDSDLTAIAGLTATNDDFIQRKAGAWTNRTIAQVKTDLGLTGTNSGDQTITLTGDATGSGTGSFAVSVVKIQGRTVASTAPTDLQVLSWNASLTQWEPRTVSGGGGGTVTSVALSLPAIFSVSGSPVTSSGTLTGTLATQTANTVWAGPTTGAAAAPTFRALVAGDIPTIAQSQVTSLTTDLAGKQPLDTDLTTISGLTPTNDDFLQYKAGAWANRTIAQVKTDLGLTGTNSGDQTITLTGDVTGSGTGSFAATIAANAVSNAKFRQSTGLSVVGRSASTTGDVADITGTDGQVLRVSGTTLGFGTIASAGIASSAVTYAKIQNTTASRLLGNPTGVAAAPSEISLGATLAFSSTTLQTAAITGDVTAAANSFATTIAANAVSNAKFRQSTGLSVVGRSASTTGDVADITGTDGQVLRVSGTTLGFGTIATAGIADTAVTFAKIQNITTARLLGRSTAGSGVVEEISIGSGLTLSAGVLSATGGGSGTVTSVALSLPTIFSVSGSPVTSAGTLTGTLATQTANTIWAGPTTGVAAAPTFRAMVAADIPDALITYAKIQNTAASRLLGNPTGSAAAPSEISLGATLAFSSTTLQTAAITGDVTASANSFATTVGKIQGRTVASTAPTDGQVLTWNNAGSQWEPQTPSGGGGGGGAPTTAQYLTLATDTTLTAERVFTPGLNLSATDGGAGSTYTLNALGGVITPTQLTADQDNYAPSGWSTSTIVRISGDTSIRAITGFDATGLSDGTRRTIINTGTAPIYVAPEHPDSTAGNRVIGDCDQFIPGNGGIMELILDGTSSRWRVISTTFNPAMPGMCGMRGHSMTVSAGSTNASDWGNLFFTGDNDTNGGTSTLPGNWEISTGATATGNANIYLSKTVLNPVAFGSAHMVMSALVHLPNLSDGTNTYTAQLAYIPTPSSTTLAVNNSVGIRYTNGTNSGKWQAFTRDNAGTESTADLGITVAADTPYLLSVCVDKGRSEARFFIDGVFCGRITGNMPNAVATGLRFGIFKSVGTTARVFRLASWSFFTLYS